MLTAIETTGTIERDGRIVIDETFSVDKPTAVRVIVLFPETEADVEREDWRRLSAKGLESAYGGSEPEYSSSHLKETNPEYERR